jgi:LPXTG-motif cell wall-anchored protein
MFRSRTYTVVRKIGLAVVLMAMTGVASAGGPGSSNCFHILWLDFCPWTPSPAPVQAPELDPASAMAGLTMLAGGLAVLRGRRKKNDKE